MQSRQGFYPSLSDPNTIDAFVRDAIGEDPPEEIREGVERVLRLELVNGMSAGVRQQAELVNRGVRGLALIVQTKDGKEDPLWEVVQQAADEEKTLPVCQQLANGMYVLGFAAQNWIIDAYAWAVQQPSPYGDMVVALLCGYSPEAIAKWFRNGKVANVLTGQNTRGSVSTSAATIGD